MSHQLILPDNPLISRDSPVLWISSCLLGNKVRFDGKDKFHRGVVTLSKLFAHFSICPELEMGLGVPREPISLKGDDLIENKSERSLKALAETTSDQIITQLAPPSALIVKSKSPSCAYKSSPNLANDKLYSGVFTQAVIKQYQGIKIVEENNLETLSQVLDFAQSLHVERSQLEDLHSVWNSLA